MVGQKRIERAFRMIFGVRRSKTRTIELFEEHGQLWIKTEYEQSGNWIEETYSVVSASGGRSVDGIDFEQI